MGEPCINLAERFGHLYRIGWEADGKTKSQWAREDWPWLMEIRCRYGAVSPFGGILLAMTDKPRIGAQLRRLPCVLHAQGDLEVLIRFHVDHIEQVLALLKPYRRRQVSEEQKRQQAERLAPYRFGKSAAVQSENTAPESTITPTDDAGATSPSSAPGTGTGRAHDAVC
ncbi:MAG: hypothetical protein U0587_08630 [Candidatus Binatia bacterium]